MSEKEQQAAAQMIASLSTALAVLNREQIVPDAMLEELLCQVAGKHNGQILFAIIDRGSDQMDRIEHTLTHTN